MVMDETVLVAFAVLHFQNVMCFLFLLPIFACLGLQFIFTTLHAMQTESSDENSVRMSVRHTRAL